MKVSLGKKTTALATRHRVSCNSRARGNPRQDFFIRLDDAVKTILVKPLGPTDEVDPAKVPALSYFSPSSLQVFFSARANHADLLHAFLGGDPYQFYSQYVSSRFIDVLNAVHASGAEAEPGLNHFNFFFEPDIRKIRGKIPVFGFWHTGILFSWNQPTPLEENLFTQRAKAFAKDLEPLWQYRPMAEQFFQKLLKILYQGNQLAIRNLVKMETAEASGSFLGILDTKKLPRGVKVSTKGNIGDAFCKWLQSLFFKEMEHWMEIWAKKGALPIYPSLVLSTHPGQDPNFLKFGFWLQPRLPAEQQVEVFKFRVANHEPGQTGR